MSVKLQRPDAGHGVQSLLKISGTWPPGSSKDTIVQPQKAESGKECSFGNLMTYAAKCRERDSISVLFFLSTDGSALGHP